MHRGITMELKQSAIKTIEELAQNTPDCISLSQGVIKVDGIAPDIKKYLQEILTTTQADYYQNETLTALLKEKIAADLARRYKISIPHDQILPTHGSMGAISTIFLSILSPGDEVIIPEPTYPLYATITRIARGTPQFVSCLQTQKEAPGFAWHLDLDAIERAITPKTKIIVFSNPMNPTGMVVAEKELAALVALCERHGIYLVVDEVYEDYVFDGSFTSIASFATSSEWVIRSSSLSKNFAMSGWRAGHAIIPKKLAKRADIIQHALMVCPSVLGQWAAIYALEHPELITKLVKTIHYNRDLAIATLEPLADKKLIAYQPPHAGFFMFINTLGRDPDQLCLDLIHKAGVSLVPGHTFGSTGNQFIRLCYARSTDVLEEGLKRFVNYFLDEAIRFN